jgi:hypothetical protein
MQNRYWKYMVQLKADSYYTGTYVAESESNDSRITIFGAIMASGSVSAWAIWKQFDILWAILVAASQVLTVIKQYLPYKKRIAPMRAVSYLYEEIFLEAESHWLDIAEGNKSESEINAIMTELKTAQLKAWKKSIGDITIPHHVGTRKKADKLTADYFSQAYNLPVTISK